MWLIIPAVDYSLKCRSTRKQAYLKKICNVRLLLVTEHTHKQGLDKDAMHFWKNTFIVEMDSTGALRLCQALFQRFLKERIVWACDPSDAFYIASRVPNCK